MAASLLIACGLNKSTLESFIHISEESNMDGGFLISSILGQRLRAPYVTSILVGLQHGFQHYLNAGMRLGYNLTLFQDKKFFIVDALQDIYDNLWKSSWLSEGDAVLEKLLQKVKDSVKSADAGASITFIIDNLSVLLNLGVSRKGLLRFCNDLHALSKENTNLTVVTKLSTCDVEHILDSNLAKIADVHITIKHLKSGIFREVDGKLQVVRESSDGYEVTQQCKEILYKVNDRNVKIFSPGEVGVKV